jgi:hypothetical protein
MSDISIRKLIQMGLSYEPSVPCASIIWLARAVNVVRPVTRRLHIDRARFASYVELHIIGGMLSAKNVKWVATGPDFGGCHRFSTQHL